MNYLVIRIFNKCRPERCTRDEHFRYARKLLSKYKIFQPPNLEMDLYCTASRLNGGISMDFFPIHNDV